MSFVAALVMVGLGAAAPEPVPQELTGAKFLELCGDYKGGDPKDWTTAGCLMYVAGFMDATRNWEAQTEILAFFDVLANLNMMARLGMLPDDAVVTLEGSESGAKTAAQLRKLQAEAVTNGVARAAAKSSEPWVVRKPYTVFQRQFCIPQGVTTNTQVLLVILKFLRDNPQRLHEPRGFLASQALSSAFPCGKE